MLNSWLDFWQQKNDFDNSMISNYDYFLSKVEKYIKLTPGDFVLDIGSGPAHLEDAWYSRVKEIHGLDISERYNAIASAKHLDHANVFFHQLKADDYLNFNIIENKKFDIIVVMSVLQYYRNKEEVYTLLGNLKKIANPGCSVLLCDLITKEGMLKDILSILWESAKAGRLLSMLRFFYKLRFSNYYHVKKNKGFLVITEGEWMRIFSDLGLTATFLTEPITIQKDRKSVLIKIA